MFDGLQEGVIVVDNGSTGFMNDLANKLLSELSGLKNFFKNRCHNGDRAEIDPLDMKLFFLFQQDKSEMTKGATKKKKVGSQSDHSKHSSDVSKIAMVEYSINDIIALSTRELSSKIFTFDRRLAT
jgi:hypothetical protein